jgi:predicted NACHT family NTPase
MNRRREGTEREFSLAVGDVSPNSKFAWRDILGEILEDGLLSSVGGALAFSHLSFQEYLAAEDLRDPFGNRQKSALRAYLRGDDWWAEALTFYLARTSRPAEMRKWVESEALATQTRRIQEGRISRLFEATPYQVDG